MTKLNQLRTHGQSVWLDYLDRDLIKSGKLNSLVEHGVCGVTSNPTIFHKALKKGDAYAEQLSELVADSSFSTEDLYEALIIQDVQDAADVLEQVYSQTSGRDGFVSLEISPELAYETDATIDAVRRLHKQVNRPNVMFKIPATREGIPAVEQLISEGININITLMFSMSHYESVINAYVSGLNRYALQHDDPENVASVASFFISRIDAKLDDWFDKLGEESLKGKIGMANAKLVYQRFYELFDNVHWQSLKEQGAHYQRLLWASTSVKSDDYPETIYVDNLIGEHTVNTMPMSTMEAFEQGGTVKANTVLEGLEQAKQNIDRLQDLDINLHHVCEELQREGVDKFLASYRSLMGLLEKKRQQVNLNVSS